jgi:hypothetical protein
MADFEYISEFDTGGSNTLSSGGTFNSNPGDPFQHSDCTNAAYPVIPGTLTGALPRDTTVTGSVSGATGTVKSHNAATSSNVPTKAICIQTSSGSWVANDVIQDDAAPSTNYWTASAVPTPDTVRHWCLVYGHTSHTSMSPSGVTTVRFRPAPGEEVHDGLFTKGAGFTFTTTGSTCITGSGAPIFYDLRLIGSAHTGFFTSYTGTYGGVRFVRCVVKSAQGMNLATARTGEMYNTIWVLTNTTSTTAPFIRPKYIINSVIAHVGGATQTAHNAVLPDSNDTTIRNTVFMGFNRAQLFGVSLTTASDHNASSHYTTHTDFSFTNEVTTNIANSEFFDATNDEWLVMSDSAMVGAGENLGATYIYQGTADVLNLDWPSTGDWEIGPNNSLAGYLSSATATPGVTVADVGCTLET